MAERRPDQARGFISFGFVIILALIIGIFLRNVRLGLIIGLVLGLLGSGLLRRR
jgi:FtsH-binding integral membrane protein